jgi:hypothetical protein
MRDRISHNYLDTVEIKRRTQTGTNQIGEPLYVRQPVETARCNMIFESTDFVREETGERVNQVPVVKFRHNTDVREGDIITDTPEGFESEYEVKSVQQVRDKIRGRISYIRCEIETI